MASCDQRGLLHCSRGHSDDGSITLTVTDGEATEQLDRDDATVAPTHTPTPVPPPAAFPVPPPAAATLSLTST